MITRVSLVPREHPAAAFAGCSPSVRAIVRAGSRARRAFTPIPGGVGQSLFGWAAEKVAGGVGAGHRVGVVDVEDQGQMERIGTGGQGFVQDAVSCRIRTRPTSPTPAGR